MSIWISSQSLLLFFTNLQFILNIKARLKQSSIIHIQDNFIFTILISLFLKRHKGDHIYLIEKRN